MREIATLRILGSSKTWRDAYDGEECSRRISEHQIGALSKQIGDRAQFNMFKRGGRTADEELHVRRKIPAAERCVDWGGGKRFERC